MKWVMRKRWIADFRDPWTHNAQYTHSPLRKKWLDYPLEKLVMSAADCVIANTPTNRRQLLCDFPSLDPERCVTITNGYDVSFSPSLVADPSQRNGKLRLTYAGVLYSGMGHGFLQAVRRVRDRNPGLARDLAVTIVGHVQPEHEEAVQRLGIGDMVDFTGFLPNDECRRRQQESDVLLYFLPDNEESRGWIPSKLFAYLRSNKPIMALVPEGDASHIIDTTRTGVCVPPANPIAIADAICNMIEAHRRGELCIAPNRTEIGRYDWRVLSRKLVHVCEDLRGTPNGRSAAVEGVVT